MRTLGCTALLLCLWSCEEPARERQITQVRDFVPVPRPSLQVVDSFTRFGYRQRPAEEAAGPAPSPFAADIPEGWTELPPKPMRELNLRVGDEVGAECYVSILRGGGGKIADNVNRWRRQMGVEPMPAEEVDALPPVPLLGADGVQVAVGGTFSGMGGAVSKPDYKLVGRIADFGPDALSVKLIGPAELVDRELAHFEQLCDSLALAGDKPPEPLELGWDAPESWVAGPAREMRTATFHPDGRDDTEVAVFVFTRPNPGDEISNLSRWYRQMGHELGHDQLESMERIPALGQQVRLLELTGTHAPMGGEPAESSGMLAVYCGLKAHVVCVKLTGPEDVVAVHRQHFLDFCASLRTQ